MEDLKKALFSPEFELIKCTKEDGKHSFVFKTEFIDVDMLASAVEVGGSRLKCLIGPNGHRFKPIGKSEELDNILAVNMPKPYEPYTLSVTLSTKSPHLKDFKAFCKKHKPEN